MGVVTVGTYISALLDNTPIIIRRRLPEIARKAKGRWKTPAVQSEAIKGLYKVAQRITTNWLHHS